MPKGKRNNIRNVHIGEEKMERKQILFGMIMMALFIVPSAWAQNLQATIGTCTDATHIQYTTNMTVNGQNYYIQTAPMLCNSGCLVQYGSIGDICQAEGNDIPIAPIALWLAMGGMIVYFRKTLAATQPIAPAVLFLIWSMAGLTITQNVLVLVPIGIATANLANKIRTLEFHLRST